MKSAAAILFAGPSLAGFDRADLSGFECRPPAAQGDIYRATLDDPLVIGLVDGHFHGVPAVWHKEILWALTRGIHVLGAASMGALRAAELHGFGMRGVGRIFEAYRDGELTDDDEVALLHGPADLGFPGLSEPLVNIRATLNRALSEGVISEDTCSALAAIAKGQYYQSRTWETVLSAAENSLGSVAGAVPVFRSWLPSGSVDQKRLDALEMVTAVRDLVASGPPPMRPDFVFEWTEAWANAPWAGGGRKARRRAGQSDLRDRVIDELRLLGPRFFELQERALLRAFAAGEALGSGAEPERGAVLAETDAFRRAHGLIRRDAFAAWTAECDTDAAAFERMMIEEAAVRRAARAGDEALTARIEDQLRLRGDYPRLAGRARDKAVRLTGAKAFAGATHMLVERHFERFGRPPPDDIEAYAADLGLAGAAEFARLLRDEEIYLRLVGEGGAAD